MTDCGNLQSGTKNFMDRVMRVKVMSKRKIAVAGTGYVGLSLAVLLAQHNHVTAVDIVPEKVEMMVLLNNLVTKRREAL